MLGIFVGLWLLWEGLVSHTRVSTAFDISGLDSLMIATNLGLLSLVSGLTDLIGEIRDRIMDWGGHFALMSGSRSLAPNPVDLMRMLYYK